MPTDKSVLQEQVEYYRARAPEYDEFFERKGRYDKGSEHTARWNAEIATVKEALHRGRLSGSVLEIACGTGLWTAELARHDVRITALDSSPEAIDLNRKRLPDEPIRYVEADIFDWTPGERFNAVVFGFWLSHVPPDRFEAFWEMVEAATVPGGRVFFVDNRWYPDYAWPHGAGHGTPSSDPNPWVVARELNDGRRFEIVKVFYEPEELKSRLEGLGWTGVVTETPEFFLWGDLRRAE